MITHISVYFEIKSTTTELSSFAMREKKITNVTDRQDIIQNAHLLTIAFNYPLLFLNEKRNSFVNLKYDLYCKKRND